jgi:very-short-patch-repair endonuclease
MASNGGEGVDGTTDGRGKARIGEDESVLASRGESRSDEDDGILAGRTRRGRLIDAAIKTWKNQLVDLSARNNLLYYRTLKVGTLHLTGQEEFVDQVLDGRSVRLSSMFAAAVPRQPFERRARAIRAKAKEAFEERGLDTMFIAFGMARWEEESDRRTAPRAPVTLVPVSLDPIAAGSHDFELRITGEPRVNPTLLRKLESEFGVPIASEEFDAEIIDATSTAALATVFSRIEELAHTVPGFAIETQTVLGTFSYAKLPMVLDLDRAREELIEHDLIAALCGDADARVTLSDRNAGSNEVRLDEPDRIAPASEFLVLDADSSQSLAINRILAGHDLIIQGPPGTGKSQTIANLISGLVANGKTVLFVAEKRAAIDAVFKRLHQVGLSDLLLDMHDGQKKRAPFAAELMQAIRKHGALPTQDLIEPHRALVNTRDQLGARTHAQHMTREPWGLSIYDARVRVAGLPEAAASDLRLTRDELTGVGAEVMRDARERLRRWHALDAVGIRRADGPWARSGVSTPNESADAAGAAREALRVLRATASTREAFTAATELPVPPTLSDWDLQVTLAEGVRESADVFRPELFDEDLESASNALAPWSAGGFARMRGQVASAEYRSAKKLIREHIRDEAGRVRPADCHQLLVAARDRQQAWRELAGADAVPVVVAELERTRESQHQLAVALQRLERFVPGAGYADIEFLPLEQTLQRMTTTDLRTLAAVAEINPIERWFNEQRLGDALASIGYDGLTEDESLARLDYIWLRSLIEDLTLAESATLGQRGPTTTVAEFRRQDRGHIAAGPVRVRRACAEIAVAARDAHRDQSLLVERQAKLRPRSRKHLPIREFFGQAPDVLRALKPCWAMSPLVVSQTLPAQRDLFDVVIFDEASQVTPADAIPAILRGRQLVIAGDSRQLPPTSFFVSARDEDEDEDEEIPVDAGTQGYESILDALAGLVPEQMLTWHYRSRDERLIAFSNAHIYNRALTTFPGADSDDVISHILVEPRTGDSISPQESSGDEVERVVDLIFEHAQQRPDDSLGVIAMGIKHADRITERLRRRREELREGAEDFADDDDIALLDDFFDESREEPFFVKNLERVQGDERDAIILTVGYGKDPATGRMLYRFGPLLQDGGERRLNVAVTRAKKRMTVVSSFTAADLDPDKLNKDGAKLLRAYVSYAESGGTSLGALDQLPPELNAFEIQVRDALLKEGIEVTPQHGVSGYRIDFAVKHPEQPGRYVLAIECDGRTYHSSPTARERDRLRQQLLEQLGWRFCRIWSSDWFDDRPAEMQRIHDAYHHAVAAADGEAPPDPFDDAVLALQPPPSTAQAHRSGPRPKVSDRYNPHEIEAIVRWVETDTLLRTRNDLFWDTLRVLGFERAGSKITPVINAAITAVRGTDTEQAHPWPPEPAMTPRPAAPPAVAAPTRAVPARPTPSSRPTAHATAPTVGDLQALLAVRIRYLPKNGHGAGSERTINPLHFSGNLMWAWCHKRSEVRCFNVTRIRDWDAVDPDAWMPPATAQADAERAARSFTPRYTPRSSARRRR